MKILVVLLTLLMPTQAYAGVRLDKETMILTLFGPTTEAQLSLTRTALKRNDIKQIRLYGNGGLFYAGLNIGELVKESKVTVVIPEGEYCMSSCAMIALAAEELFVEGSLGLHAPYLESVPVTMSPVEYGAGAGHAFLDMAMFLMDKGFPLKFTQLIVGTSTPCSFLMIESEEQVKEWKGEPLSDIPDPKVTTPMFVDMCALEALTTLGALTDLFNT
jgi:hypothetical protein